MTFRLLSAARPETKYQCAKPETTVIADLLAIRERQPDEQVHFRNDQGQRCRVCHRRAGVWTDSETIWNRHETRCSQQAIIIGAAP